MPFGIQSRSDSFERSVRFTRRTATVTISAPEISRASFISGKVAYLPVPTMRREANVRPPKTKGSEDADGAAAGEVGGVSRVVATNELYRSFGALSETLSMRRVFPTRTAAASAARARHDRAGAWFRDRRRRRSRRRARRARARHASRLSRRRASVSPARRGRRAAKRAFGQERGALALLGREVGVARGEREAVRLAHGLADDEAQRKVQVAHHPADHGDLLQILAAEVRDVGRDLEEELRDDGRHAAEVARADRAFAALGDALRRRPRSRSRPGRSRRRIGRGRADRRPRAPASPRPPRGGAGSARGPRSARTGAG